MITRWLHRIGHACGAHSWRTALAWLVVLGAVTAASALAGGALRDSMEVPGSSSARATSSLRAHFPAETGAEAHWSPLAVRGTGRDPGRDRRTRCASIPDVRAVDAHPQPGRPVRDAGHAISTTSSPTST